MKRAALLGLAIALVGVSCALDPFGTSLRSGSARGRTTGDLRPVADDHHDGTRY